MTSVSTMTEGESRKPHAPVYAVCVMLRRCKCKLRKQNCVCAKTHVRKAQKHGLERLRFPTAEKTHGLSQKIQGTYFEISALYFKIYGLYFSPFQISDKQQLTKAFQNALKVWFSEVCEKLFQTVVLT